MENDLKTPGERLRAFIRASQYRDVANLARATRLSVDTIRKHIRGERKISEDRARTYGLLLGKRWEEILYGKRFNQVTGNTPIKGEATLAPRLVPLLSCFDLGQWGSIVAGNIPMSENTVPAPGSLDAGKNTVAYLVEEAGMEGDTKESIARGEYVFIDPEAKIRSGNIVVAMAPGFDHVIIRKYRVKALGEGGTPQYDLVPLNPDEPSVIDGHAQNVQIVGRVIGAYRIF